MKHLRQLVLKIFALFSLFGLTYSQAYAQCTGGSCNGIISTNVNVTIPAGQTYCLQISGYTSTITFGTGSTLCIGSGYTWNGANFTFSGATGTINNYGTSTKTFTLPTGYTFNNYGTYSGALSSNAGSTINNSGTLTHSGGTIAGTLTTASGSTTTNSGGATISGTLTNTGGSITNAGTISGATSISGTLTNNGTMNSGSVTINSGGTFSNTVSASVNITMNAGSTFTNSSTYGGTMTNNGGTINNTGTFSNSFTLNGTLNNNSGGNLSNGVTVASGGSVSNSGSIGNTLTIQSGGSVTNNASGTISATISDAGTLTTNGNITGGISLTGSGVFTNNYATLNATISGMASGTTFNNNGTYSGNITSSAGSTITNNGTLTLTGGTVSGTFTGAAGSHTTNSGGSLSGNTTISGTLSNTGSATISGTLTISATGSVTNSSSNVSAAITLNGTLTNSGTLSGVITDNAGSTLTNTGNITNGTAMTINGTLNNNSGGSISTPLIIPSGTTLTNNGTLSGTLTINAGGTVINSSGGTISGTSSVSGTLTNAGNITNTITVNSGGSVTNNYNTLTAPVTVLSGGSFTNTGTYSGTINGNAGSTVTNSGTLTIGSGSTVAGTFISNTGSTTNNNGTISGTLTLTGTLNNSSTISGAITDNAGSTLNNNSGGNITNSTALTVNGTINNNGSATISTPLIVTTGVTVTNSGTLSGALTINSGGTVVNNSSGSIHGPTTDAGTLTNNGTESGTTTISAGGTMTTGSNLSGTVIVNGTFTVNSGASPSMSSVTVNSGGTVNNNGTIQGGTLTGNAGSTITNSGTISDATTTSGTLTNNSGATISGTLTGNTGSTITNSGNITNTSTISGTLTNNSGGTMNTVIENAGGAITNSGSMSAGATVNGGTFIESSGGSITNGGANNININGGSVTLNGNVANVNITGGTLTNNATIGSNFTVSGGTVNNSGTISASYTQSGGTVNNLSGGTINPSSLHLNGSATDSISNLAGGTLTFPGGSNTIPSGMVVTNTGTFNTTSPLTISTGATLNLEGTQNMGSATVSNSGTINLSGSLSVSSYTGGSGSTFNEIKGGCNIFTTGSNSGTTTFNGGNSPYGGGLIVNTLGGSTINGASGVIVAPSVQGSSLGLSVSALTVSGSFTAPAGTYSGFIVLRYVGTTAPSCNPVNYTAYSVGNTIGACTVVAIIPTTTAGTKTFTDNIPLASCGENVYYEIFSYYGAGECVSFDLTSPLNNFIAIPNASVTITPSGATTFCSGGNVTLTASVNQSYLWSTTATTQAVTATTTGSYTVTATNNAGCTASASNVVTVNNAGTITPYLNTSAGGGWQSVTTDTVCAGGWVDFGSQSSVAGTGGTWTISGPNGFYSYSRDTTISNLQAINAGTYIQTYYDAANGCSVSISFTIVVNTAPSVTITASGPTTFCSGSSVTLTASGVGAYLWSNGATTDTITVSPAGTTTYTVTVTNSGSSCNTASASQVITVNSPGTFIPYLNTSAGGGWQSVTTATICSGGWVDFGSQNWSASTWTITGPNGFYSYSRDTTISNLLPINSGTYIETSYTSNGCSVSQNFTITVQAYPIPNVNNPTVCAGSTATLTANGGGTYLWSTGSTTDTIMSTTSSTYTVTVTTSAGCSATGSGTSTISSGSASVTVASGCGTGALSILTASGGGTYLWNTGATTASITSSSVTTYTVTVTNAFGCTATATATSTFYIGSGPSVTLSSNTPVCVGSTIDLTATPSGSTSYTYSWSGPNAFTSTVQAPTIPNSYQPDSGSYTVTVTDNHGCTVSGTTSVLVNSNCVDSVSTTVNNGGGSSYAPCTEILRFDHYNAIVASTAQGQNHTWILGNGNVLTMNIKCVAGGFTAVPSPSWSGSAFGVTGYTGLGGKTVLYTNASGWSKLVFSNIVLKDASGTVIPNFTLVGIDGESTDNAERDTLTSNGTTWFDYDTINPPPTVGSIPSETGIGTNQLVWTGNGPSNARARLVSTNGPTNFTFSTVAGGLQGYAMGVSNLVLANLDDTICSGTSFNNTPKNEPIGTTYTWSAPAVSPAGSVMGANAQLTPSSTVSQTLINTTTSTVTVTYTVMPSNTCSDQGFTFHVFVKPNASATILPGTPQCAGNTIIASAVTTPAATYTYHWTGPAGFTATGDSFTINPSSLANAGTYTVIITSTSGCHDTVSGPIQVVNCLSVSGAIFDDANGNGILDGIETKTSLGHTLYSVLSDTTNKVVATGTIAANGSFSMGQMLPNTNGFHVYVSTSNPSIGSAATGYTWPGNWAGTLGQYGSNNGAGTGVYPVSSELMYISTDTSNIINMLIGYDQLPTTIPQIYTIPYPGINSQRQLIPAKSLGILSGSDPEDGSYGSGNTFVISGLAGMNGNQLYYDANGDGILESWEQITGYTAITNYNPNRMYIKFTGAASMSATFQYTAEDAAGKAGASPFNYVINWLGALPVQLEYFTANKDGNSSLLNWATASEINNAYFDVERSSDAETWQSIGQVKGAGTTEVQQMYSFTDDVPFDGTDYYRLKQVDVDGNFKYSDIAEVTFGGEIQSKKTTSLSVYPNPLSQSDQLNIALENGSDNISEVSIVNEIGQIVYSTLLPQIQNYQIVGLDLPSGIYMVKIQTQSNTQLTSRLVIAR